MTRDERGDAPDQLAAERDALAAAVLQAPRRHLLDDAAAKEATLRFATRARAAGMPPERLLIELKALVREAAADVGDWYRAVLTDRIVVWGIEGYYRATQTPPSIDD